MNQSLAARQAHELQLQERLPCSIPDAPEPQIKVRGTVLLLITAALSLWGGLGSWAAVSKVQSAVIASGSFRVEGSLPVIQHLEGGLIRKVNVREGDSVEAGQVLVELSGTISNAQEGILSNQLLNALIQERRVATEIAGKQTIEADAELASLIAADANAKHLLEMQQELLASKNAMWRGQISILETRLDEQKQQLAGLTSQRATQDKRLALVQDELEGLLSLYKNGLVTKNQIIIRQDAEAALLGDTNYVLSQIDGLRDRMSETRERILMVHRERDRSLSEEMQQVTSILFDIRQRITAARDVRDRLLVRAPIAGRVMDLKFTAVGEVIKEGEDILKIVPDDARYVIEGKLRPEDVDQVSQGATARVRLTAYNFRTTAPVAGTVIHVSPDSFTDDVTGQQYYKVNVRLVRETPEVQSGVQIKPGMPAQVMITTGEQSVADYLIGPLWAGLDTALRESY